MFIIFLTLDIKNEIYLFIKKIIDVLIIINTILIQGPLKKN
jgi:hypothetical protein